MLQTENKKSLAVWPLSLFDTSQEDQDLDQHANNGEKPGESMAVTVFTPQEQESLPAKPVNKFCPKEDQVPCENSTKKTYVCHFGDDGAAATICVAKKYVVDADVTATSSSKAAKAKVSKTSKGYNRSVYDYCGKCAEYGGLVEVSFTANFGIDASDVGAATLDSLVEMLQISFKPCFRMELPFESSK